MSRPGPDRSSDRTEQVGARPGRTGTEQAGATRDEASRRKGRPWWLLALLALLVIGALLFALSQCGGPANSGAQGVPASPGAAASSAVAQPTTASVPSTAASPATAGVGQAAGAGTGIGTGTLTAGGTSLLPVAAVAGTNGDLTSQIGKQAAATGAVVQSVPANEGFWVGTSTTDRVWVQLTGGGGESGYTVEPGDHVTFAGTIVAHDAGFAQKVGLAAADGAEQLTNQKAHIEVAKSALRGAST